MVESCQKICWREWTVDLSIDSFLSRLASKSNWQQKKFNQKFKIEKEKFTAVNWRCNSLHSIFRRWEKRNLHTEVYVKKSLYQDFIFSRNKKSYLKIRTKQILFPLGLSVNQKSCYWWYFFYLLFFVCISAFPSAENISYSFSTLSNYFPLVCAPCTSVSLPYLWIIFPASVPEHRCFPGYFAISCLQLLLKI